MSIKTLEKVSVIPSEDAGSIVSADANSIMAVISRAANDPNTNVEKLERLMAMYERITDRSAKSAYAAALAAMSPELPVIAERGKIQIGTGKAQMYALWEDINDAIKPVLAKHGFALSFRTGTEDGKIVVTGILSHRDGHSEETTMYLPIDSSGSKNAVQAVGSSTSYGKRYTASALLNLTSRGEDDDGKAANAGNKITPDQLGDIQALMDDVGANRELFLKYMKVASLADISAKDFKRACDALNAKRAK